MHERDLRPMRTRTRRLIDEPHARRFRRGKLPREVGHFEAHVVQSRTTRLEELGDRVVGALWFEQLEGDRARVHEHHLESAVIEHLTGVTPGIHPAYARHYIRRVRFGAADPLVEKCRKRGYPVLPDIGIDGREDRTRWVVEFPCQSPDGSILASDMTAVQQLEWVREMQTDWSDNAVSVTVYYRKDELSAIKEWLAANYDESVKSVSFLLHADHNFPLPPYEECSEVEYDKRLAAIYFTVAMTDGVTGDLLDIDACATGACPVR